jgi:hypothetical protein
MADYASVPCPDPSCTAQPTAVKPATMRIGSVFAGPQRSVVVSTPITATDVDAMATAICAKFMELCTTFETPPPGTQFGELGESGKDIWRTIARSGLEAIGVEWPLETGSVWVAPENASGR